MSRYAPRSSLDQVYKSHVRSHLENCDVISTNNLSTDMKKLESVQTQAAYAVSGAWKGTSRGKNYEELGWEWLTQRRWYRRMVFFYKIVKKISPIYLTDCITYPDPPWISAYGRQPPNANPPILTPITPRRLDVQSSFFPSCVFSWNRFLTVAQRNAMNIKQFQNIVLSSFKPEKTNNFSINDRMGLRFLTQLRVDLNPLRKYKFERRFLDTTDEYCLCGFGIEDVDHYLLHCHQFIDIRNELFDNISGIIGNNVRNYRKNFLKNLILYGSEELHYDVNKGILNETIKFIHKSEKFRSTVNDWLSPFSS